jgi:hypothetical protein
MYFETFDLWSHLVRILNTTKLTIFVTILTRIIDQNDQDNDYFIRLGFHK